MNKVQRANSCPLIVGHRGNPGNPLNSKLVENTEQSFESAWSVGASGIELDVQISKDGVLFCHHDDNLGRVFAIPGDSTNPLVRELDWKEIAVARLIPSVQTLNDLDSKKVVIPQLREVMIADKGLLFLELKFPEDREPRNLDESNYLDRLVRASVRHLHENNLVDRAYVLSFVRSALDRVKYYSGEIKTFLNIRENETEQANFEQFLQEIASQLEISGVNPSFSQTTKRSVNVCHDNDLETFPWTDALSEKKELSEVDRLSKLGVDGLITNQPEESISIIA